jgi:Zn-dependent protease with chaperone function
MPEWKPAGVLTANAAQCAALARGHARALLLSACLIFAPVLSIAQAPPPQETLPADIPGQALATALVDFAHLTGLQIVYVDRIVGEQKTRGAPAGLTPADALTRLLEGTALRYEFLNPRLVRILPPAPQPGGSSEPTLEVVIYARVPGVPKARPFAPASEGELLKMRLANEEIERQIAHEGLLYEDVALESYLNQLAAQLLASDNTDASAIHVHITKGTNAAALTLSDGSIYLSTALLTGLNDESQLAAVLGRELTHYTNQHELRGLRREKSAWATGVTMEVLLALAAGLAAHHSGTPGSPGAFQSPPPRPSLGVWVRASVSGYPRDMEWEADDGSVHRLIAAGYDGTSALTALYALAAHASGQSEDVPLYASQPKLYAHITSYRHLLEGEFAGSATNGLATPRDAYRARLGELPLEQVALLLEAGALERADAALTAELAVRDGGRAQFLQGEIARRRVPQTDATVARAIAAYERAVSLPGAPPSAYRQAGLLHRLRGENDAATLAFQNYLQHAPAAVDAPLVRIYLEELGAAAPLSNARR